MATVQPVRRATWDGFGRFILGAIRDVPKGLWSIVSAPSAELRYTKPPLCQCRYCGKWHYRAIAE